MKRRQRWVAKAIEWAAYAVCLIAGIMVFGTAMSTEAIDGNFLLAFLAIGITGFVATLIHEIGHAWVALRRGAEIRAIAALPFVYFPRTRKLAFTGKRTSGDIAGYVTYSFPEDGGTRRDEMAIAAAGPLWNFASAGLLILALWSAPTIASLNSDRGSHGQDSIVTVVEGAPTGETKPIRLPSDEELRAYLSEAKARKQSEALGSLAESLVQILIVISIASGALNLLPYRGSDGAIILEHWRWLRKLS